MTSPPKYLQNILIAVILLLLVAGLWYAEYTSYLFFHNLVELFSIIISFSIFILVLNARKWLQTGFFLILGFSMLPVSVLDLIHMLSYRGMPFFQDFPIDLTLQVWIAARFLQSVSLLAAILFMERSVRPGLLLSSCAAVTLVFLLVIFSGLFPPCFNESSGLTGFKVISEYVVIAIAAASLVLIFSHREYLSRYGFWLIFAAIGGNILSEFAFTRYADLYDFMNKVGHILKVVSFYCFYLAIIARGLMHPYEVLFGDLKRKEAQLEEMKRALEVDVQNKSKDLDTTLNRLVDEESRHQSTQDAFQTQTGRLSQLLSIGAVMSSSDDIAVISRSILAFLQQGMKVEAGSLYLIYPDTPRPVFVAQTESGYIHDDRENMEIDITTGSWKEALTSGELIILDELQDNREQVVPEVVRDEGFVKFIGVPLIVKEGVVGLLKTFYRTDLQPDERWLMVLRSVAMQAAIAIHTSETVQALEDSNKALVGTYEETLNALVNALDIRDSMTNEHTKRVVEKTLCFAKRMGITADELVNIRRGALLHDIGKIAVPDHILRKPGPLTDEEWVIMKTHPAVAYQMINPVSFLRPAIDIPYSHHEKWDGTGYPQGLKGEEIPIAARMFAIIDIWDALTSDRPYREAWSHERTIEHIRGLSGTHLDPALTDVFLKEIVAGCMTPDPSCFQP